MQLPTKVWKTIALVTDVGSQAALKECVAASEGPALSTVTQLPVGSHTVVVTIVIKPGTRPMKVSCRSCHVSAQQLQIISRCWLLTCCLVIHGNYNSWRPTNCTAGSNHCVCEGFLSQLSPTTKLGREND